MTAITIQKLDLRKAIEAIVVDAYSREPDPAERLGLFRGLLRHYMTKATLKELKQWNEQLNVVIEDAPKPLEPGCPECGSDQCEAKGVDVEGMYARQDVVCANCQTMYRDIYVLVEHLVIEKG